MSYVHIVSWSASEGSDVDVNNEHGYSEHVRMYVPVNFKWRNIMW